MVRLRPVAIATLAAAVALSGAAATVPARAEGQTITGKTSNRHGTFSLRFTSDPGMMRLELGGKVRKTSRGKRIRVDCLDDGRYVKIISILVGVTSRYLGGPVSAPTGTERCRVKRDGKVVATMRMRTTGQEPARGSQPASPP